MISNNSRWIGAAIALMVAPPALAKDRDIGPEPDYARAKQVVKAWVLQNLKDPDSAKFDWRGEGWNKTKKGWVICGRVNAKNSYGGYTGYQQFRMRVVNGVSDGSWMAPPGLGHNDCNSKLGYHSDNDW